jgi:serine protease Do
MKNFTQQQVIVMFVIMLLTAVLSGAGGVYLFQEYSGSQALQEKVIEKDAVIEKEYVPQTTHEQKVINVVEEVSGGVVSIIASKDVPVFEQFFRSPFQNDPFFRQFFPEFQMPDQRQNGTERQEVSAGTGFVVSSDGLIITNKHVVSDEEADYTVISNDGEKYEAEVLARDPLQDLAVLKIDNPKGEEALSSLRLGDSDSLKQGQSVIAIGNALGEFQNTVSVGVISGLRRTVVASSGFGQSETLEEVIQTDTAINPGNSGGPLLNLSGEVVGINVARASAENIGFAIPINAAKKDIEDVEQSGKITYPFLGIRYVMISDELVERNDLEVDYGALVLRGETREDLAVIPGSAADKAGIVENDIILEIKLSTSSGQAWVKITQENPLAKEIQKYRVGDTITLKILSKGKEKEVQATLGER